MKTFPATGSAAQAIMTPAAKTGSSNTQNAKTATAMGWSTSLHVDSQNAVDAGSADLLARDEPIAKSAPGVAAPPSIRRKSSTGAGIETERDAQIRPSMIATTIGFLINPRPTVLNVCKPTAPSCEPVIKITMRLLNTIKSTARTIMIGPIALSPNSSASMGIPRNPTFPMTAHCASTAASAIVLPRKAATTVASA